MYKFNKDKQAEKYHDMAYDEYENGNYKKSFKYYLKSAVLGYPEAQHMIGYLYWNGQGVRHNKKKSTDWYKKAIKNGVGYSAHNLALNYKDENKLRWYEFWLKRAAAMGISEAEDELKELIKNS